MKSGMQIESVMQRYSLTFITILIIFAIAALINSIILIIFGFTLYSADKCTVGNEPHSALDRTYLIVDRVEWNALPSRRPLPPLEIQPPPELIISHTSSGYCYTRDQCIVQVQVAQKFHINSLGYDDIAYNFLVGGDGTVYVGRGWDIEGAHTDNHNSKSLSLSFIGTFNYVNPTEAQLLAAKQFIEYCLRSGKLSEDYKLLGHRQCADTESPGELLYNIIKTWYRWSPDC